MGRLFSRPGVCICPFCEEGNLHCCGSVSARCDLCSCVVEHGFFVNLEKIIVLPEALGAHACECGHPEMRRLPDGVFHCPACGAEVMPSEQVFTAASGRAREARIPLFAQRSNKQRQNLKRKGA